MSRYFRRKLSLCLSETVRMMYLPVFGLVTSRYRVRAKDSQNKYSNYSEEVANRTEPLGKSSIKSAMPMIPLKFSFSSYPNPFNPTTNINFTLEKNAFIQLRVYDILGREINNIINEFKEKGSYSYPFNGGNLASGIYLVVLRVNNMTYSKKIILNK